MLLIHVLAFLFNLKFCEAVSCNFSYGCLQNGTQDVKITLDVGENFRTDSKKAFSLHWYGSEKGEDVLDVQWVPDKNPKFECPRQPEWLNIINCSLSDNGTQVQATILHPIKEGKYKLQKVGSVGDHAICFLNLSLNCSKTIPEMTEESGANIGIIIGCVLGALLVSGLIAACWKCLRYWRGRRQGQQNHSLNRQSREQNEQVRQQDQRTEQAEARLTAQNSNGQVDTSSIPQMNDTINKFGGKSLMGKGMCSASPLRPDSKRPADSSEINGIDTPCATWTTAVRDQPELQSRSSIEPTGVEMTIKVKGPPKVEGGEGTGGGESVVKESVADDDRKAGEECDLKCQQEKGEERESEEEKEYRRQGDDNDNDNGQGDVEEGKVLASSVEEEVDPTEQSHLLS